jgi:hypothetical protein
MFIRECIAFMPCRYQQKKSVHCCPIYSLSLRERVGVRGSNQANHLIFYPLILSFSRREKGRNVFTGMYSFHVLSL